MRVISRDVKIAVFSTVVGIAVGSLLGYLLSDYFYQLAKREARKEVRQELLEGLFVDLAHNTLDQNFPQLYDSVGFIHSSSPWRKLVASGVDRLYFNILSFIDYHKFEEFVDIVNRAKLATDDFNDRMELRNISILLGRDLAKSQNPEAYHYYQWIVRPDLLKLLDYIQQNRSELVSE